MFPGDIFVRVPEFSSILRDSIYDTKLAGTRIYFQYYIFIGIFHMEMSFDMAYSLVIASPKRIQNYDIELKYLGPLKWDTQLGNILEYQLTNGVRGNIADYYNPIGHTQDELDERHHGNLTAGIQILTYYKAPWINGWVLNVPGLTNYRGFIQPDENIRPNEILYK